MNALRFRFFVSLIALTSLFLAAGPNAQAPPGPLPPKPGTQIQKRPAAEKPKIRVKTDLVATPVTVRNAAGEMVLDLGASDFRVFDNGVQQKIEHFDLGGDPLSIALIFETSSRVSVILPAVRKAGIVFAQNVVGSNGEACILGVNDNIDTLLPFSANADQIQKVIEHLPEGTSGVRLYDAMSLAVGQLRGRPTDRRRVMLVVSESADTGSEDKLGVVLREAQLANISIYGVTLSSTSADLRAPPKQVGPQITPPGVFPMPPQPGTPQTPTTEQQRYGNIDYLAAARWLVEHATSAVRGSALSNAAVATGGMNISPFRDRTIENAVDAIGGELHGQYVLTYKPEGEEPVGYHEIKVEVSRAGLSARARPGYYLSPPDKPSN
jgi:VWFA-related protein